MNTSEVIGSNQSVNSGSREDLRDGSRQGYRSVQLERRADGESDEDR